MSPLLKVENISKNFTPPLSLGSLLRLNLYRNKNITHALNDVSFSLEKGKILGILGPNGAGKTTLLKIIATLIIPDEGKVSLNDIRIDQNEEKIKTLVGMVLAPERSFYCRLTGRQNLNFFARLYGLDNNQIKYRISELLDIFKIDYEDKRFDSYSTGMQQKFSIIRSLLHDPKLLLFDEPTKSLDYVSALGLRRLIKEDLVKNKEKTVIFTTHHMDEVIDFANIFMIMHKGKIFGLGTLEELRIKINNPRATMGEIFIKLTEER